MRLRGVHQELTLMRERRSRESHTPYRIQNTVFGMA